MASPVCVLLLLFPFILACGVILEPLEEARGSDVSMIFLHGANVPPDRYVPLGRQIQLALKEDARLWLGLPEVDMMDPRGVDDVIKGIQSDMAENGMAAVFNFISGHSLGGVTSQDFVYGQPEGWDGQVLMSSVLLKKYDNRSYPLSTLTLGGEKDGNMRISRLAQASHVYKDLGKEVDFPVVVIKGANHMSFASGQPPLPVAALDLKPEIGLDEAHESIGRIIADYLKSRIAVASTSSSSSRRRRRRRRRRSSSDHREGDDYAHAEKKKKDDVLLLRKHKQQQETSPLQEALKTTAQLVDPLIQAMLLEGSWHFQAPCNSDHPSPHCPFYPAWPPQEQDRVPSNDTNCVCGSPWVQEVAQAHIGDLEGYATYVVRDAFHDVRDTEPYHHAHLWNNCTSDELMSDTCVLNITTVTQLVYPMLDEFDTGFTPTTASEMKVKMKSRQSIYQQTIDPTAKLEDTDKFNFCAEINAKAFQWALEHVPYHTRERYDAIGVQMVFDADIRHLIQIGPVWINSPLVLQERYDVSTKKWMLHVQSPTMVTDVTAHIYPDSAGFHYCKLLSPARAMEWIYVDGLRRYDRNGLEPPPPLVSSY